MVRAVLAICLPVAVGMEIGQAGPGLLVALGGLLGVVVDNGGAMITARLRRVGSAAVGGAAGLVLGSVLHGHGWTAVVALVAVAGVSALLSAISGTGSVTGLELLVYAVISLGPLGGVHPAWRTAVSFVLGAAWALLLIVPGWLLSRRSAVRRSVAAAYRSVAEQLQAIGSPRAGQARRQLTDALNTAVDQLITFRATATGRNPRLTQLMALLNQANLLAEAATALCVEGTRPPPQVIATLNALADAIEKGTRPPPIPQVQARSPGMRALRDDLDGVARILSGSLAPDDGLIRRQPPLPERLNAVADRMIGTSTLTFAVRLMACTGVAGVLTEVLPLQRSYWVIMTVVIVLKPDFGSVFIRAVQRGAGTVLGAVLGVVILILVPLGPWLLVPFALLAALLPYGRSRNFGLMSVFLTPLVVLLIDLFTPGGWHLALDRLLDTLLGCAVVLLIGYAPWPSSWHAHLPEQFAAAARQVSRYLEVALDETAQAAQRPGGRTEAALARRDAYRALADLRTEFDRLMSEPTGISRRAAAWWPALVALEEVVDAITAASVATRHGARNPDRTAVRQLISAVDAIADALRTDTPPRPAELPADPALAPVTDAVRAVLAILTGSRQQAPAELTYHA